SCGFTFQVGMRYQVFAQHVDGALATGLCSGTRQVSGLTSATALPTPAIPPPVDGDGQEEAVPQSTVSGPSNVPMRVAVPVGVLVVISLAGGALVARRRRGADAGDSGGDEG